jgi:hypothetical protein
MSIKVLAYVPSLTDNLLSQISARFADFDMQIEFHPSVRLTTANGFIASNLLMQSAAVPQYDDAPMYSEFEFSSKPYTYTAPLSVNPAINERLRTCSRVCTIRMHATHTNALRVGLYFATFLADVTGGVIYTPRSDEYLEPEAAIQSFTTEIDKYERELPPTDWRVTKFVDWS